MIEGQWYAPRSAKRCSAKLNIYDAVFKLEVEDGILYQGSLSSLKVSSRLGNVERKLTLEDGSVFATYENDKIDDYFKDVKNVNSILHTLESHLGLTFVALFTTLLVGFVFFKWGIPWTSKHIAHALPHKTNLLIAKNSFKFLDKYILDESNLSKERKEEIRKHFKVKLLPLNENKEVEYKINFRAWNQDGLAIPNALALPSGDIILTDKFVKLCKTQEEMDAVMLHEMGHVVHRHTLEMVIEGTFMSVAVMVIAGDSNVMADMGIGIGSLLASSNFSRDHESEADSYAFKKMLTVHIDPASFSNIMERMMAYIEEERQLPKKKKKSKKVKKDMFDYLSSHPSTQKRIELANKYSECFKQGLTTCNVEAP